MLFMSLFVGVGLYASPVLAQHEVTGEVTDAEQGGSLPGVNIVVQGTQIGTTTRSNGSYTLEVPSPQDTLIFSFVGYEQTEVPIEGRSELDVALQPAVTALDEVVVNVGYTEQAVETTTGSQSQVSGEELEVEPSTNLTNTLQGAVPGIFGVNDSGEPGYDGSALLIRGMATLGEDSPLVVIDGVPGRQGGLARLNPSDIQSVSVLKDASAAIYGSRAANGVILVETKRGSEGEPQVSVNVEHGYNQPTMVPEMTNAATYLTMLNELSLYRGNERRYSQEEIDKHRGDLSDNWQYHNTDWYDAALKNYSQQTQVDASVSGGLENFRYRISGRALTEDGIYKNSATQYNQVELRSNLDGDVSDNVTVSLDLHGRMEDRNFPTNSAGDIFWMLQRGYPDEPAFWPNGQPGPDIENGINPAVAATPVTGYDEDEDYFFQSDLTLDAEVPAVDGLSFTARASYDRRMGTNKTWEKPWTLYYWDYESYDENDNPDLTPTEVGYPEPRLTEASDWEEDVLLRGQGRYETDFGSHNASLMVGTEYQGSEASWNGLFRRYYASDAIDEPFAGGSSQQDNWGSGSHAARFSVFGRANYNYQEKYLLEFVARYDGSYIFPEGDRFGFFPVISGGWRLAQEDWFGSFTNDFFDRLKLRASYGQTGNDQIEPYQYLRSFDFSNEQVWRSGEIENTISPARVPNPKVSWEVANQLDVGIEGAILDERLTFDVAYFDYLRTDILWWRNASVPQSAGFSLPRENIGEVSSWGFDGQLAWAQDVSQEVSFRVATNVSYAKDKIEYWAEAPGDPPYQRSTGAPMETALYFVADGIFTTQQEIDNNPSWPDARPGDIRFKDIDGDGEIDGDDRKRIHFNERPDLIGGLNLRATVDQVSVRAQFQGAAQVRRYIQGTHGEFGNYFQEFADRRWRPSPDDANVPHPDHPNPEGPRAFNRQEPYWISNQNTYFLRDSKYFRLKSAQVSYSLPSNWTDRVGLGGAQIYLTGRNLFTLTPIEILDPEMTANGAEQYPPSRNYTVGIQTSF